MVRYHYDMHELETTYTEELLETNAFELRPLDFGYSGYTFDKNEGMFSRSGSRIRANVSSETHIYRVGDSYDDLESTDNNSAGTLLAKISTRSFDHRADIYEAAPLYSKGAFIQSIISTDEEEANGVYPANGPNIMYGLWFVRREVYSPYPKMKVDGAIREYSDGWVKVNGVLRQIDSMSVKVNGEIREV